MDLPDKEKSALHVMQLYESIILAHEIDWSFDNIRNFINTSDLAQSDKSLLLSLMSLPQLENDQRHRVVSSIKDSLSKKKTSLSSIFKDLFRQRKREISDIRIRSEFEHDEEEKGWYNWRIFIDESQETINRIDYVKYILHPSFSEPVQTIEESKDKFMLRGRGWGEFEVKVEVVIDSGKATIEKYHWLSLGGSLS
jgi:hypothetical protein